MANTARNLDEAGTSSQEIRNRYTEFRTLLLERRTEVLRRNHHEMAQLDSQVLTSPGDVGDMSVVDTGADYYLTLADNDRRELAEISAALGRMQRGIYGVCESCEGDILVERLEKLPQARLCIDCQSSQETKFRSARPLSNPKL